MVSFDTETGTWLQQVRNLTTEANRLQNDELELYDDSNKTFLEICKKIVITNNTKNEITKKNNNIYRELIKTLDKKHSNYREQYIKYKNKIMEVDETYPETFKVIPENLERFCRIYKKPNTTQKMSL